MRQMKKMGNVKLKDIVEALNVSTVTVSNALAGRKGVSEEVRSQEALLLTSMMMDSWALA